MNKNPKAWRVGNRIVYVNDAVPAELHNNQVCEPPISKCVTVVDPDREQVCLILIRRVNDCPIYGQRIRKLVKFTERQYAPSLARFIKLATPTHYRAYEGIEKGVCDPTEGLLAIDATPWIRRRLSSELASSTKVHLEAKVSMASPCEPWVYCTSICPDGEPDLRKLRHEFSPKYDTVTTIQDPDAFAIQLGVDFAINLNKSEDIELGVILEWLYRNSSVTTNLWEGSRPIDKIIHVGHGPVLYEDQPDVTERLEDFANFCDWYKPCFTKPTSFSSQVEYRFALSTSGKPKKDEVYVKVSGNLKNLVVLQP